MGLIFYILFHLISKFNYSVAILCLVSEPNFDSHSSLVLGGCKSIERKTNKNRIFERVKNPSARYIESIYLFFTKIYLRIYGYWLLTT